MPAGAPRIPWPLIVALRTLDDPDRPIAEVWRAICAVAEEQGFTYPSYEQVRRLVTRHRQVQDMPGPVAPLIEGWLRARSPVNAADEARRRSLERRSAREMLEAEREWRPDGRSERSR